MKTIILILFFTINILAQNNLPLLFSDSDYDIDAKTYFDAAPTSLSVTQKTRINNFVKMLKDSLAITSLSSIFDVMYLLANEDSVTSKLNLVKRGHDAVTISDPTFTQWEGWTGATTGAKFIKTLYTPSTDFVNFTRNSASIGFYNRTNSTGSYDLGYLAGSHYATISINAATTFRVYLNSTTNSDFTSTNKPNAMWIASRTASNIINAYQDGVVLNQLTTASTGNADGMLYLFGYNDGSDPPAQIPNRQMAFFFTAKGLDATQARKITNCIEWYMDQVGTGVIP